MSTAEMKAPPDADRIIGPPDHLGLPESDGRIVENFNEHPQGMILSDSLLPILMQKHPDGRFALGRDSGIYYKWDPDEPPLSGAISPDWYYVPDVPPTLAGHYRRSYVLWKELVVPLIILEFASGDGSEERDRTPPKGKFWVYERAIRPAYYGIFVVEDGTLEMHEHVGRPSAGWNPTSAVTTPSPSWAWSWASGTAGSRTSISPGCAGSTPRVASSSAATRLPRPRPPASSRDRPSRSGDSPGRGRGRPRREARRPAPRLGIEPDA